MLPRLSPARYHRHYPLLCRRLRWGCPTIRATTSPTCAWKSSRIYLAPDGTVYGIEFLNANEQLTQGVGI